MSSRDFDVVLYGASGFVGRQAVAYFRRHAPGDLRWAIAGRDPAKLATLGAEAPILVADARTQGQVDAIVARTRVLATTAGPFRLFGDPFVDACVRLGTDYVDISGDAARIRDLVDRYHRAARVARVRLVNFCAVSSTPADLGVFLLGKQLGGRLREAKGFVRLGGGSFSGGTIASISHSHDSGDAARTRDILLLNPDLERRVLPLERDPQLVRYDCDAKAWTAQSPMGISDTRAVRRSGVLRGQDIAYQEYAVFPGWAGFFRALGFSTLLGLFGVAMRFRAVRRWLQKKMPPGTGPSETEMDAGWYELRLLGRSHDGHRARVIFKGQGEAGTRLTVKCLCESALALAVDRPRLPDMFGVLTPSAAFGDVLANRLRAAGIEIRAEMI
jgi:short subunit dehydrogenase-like uncharacterized protein